MIQIISGFPEDVVACSAQGRVTKDDYERVLIPAIEAKLRDHAKIKCYYELGAAFSSFDFGAAWEDAMIGLGHLTRWERIALVSDVEWIRLATNAFRFLMPGSVRVFSTSQAAEAKAWLTGA